MVLPHWKLLFFLAATKQLYEWFTSVCPSGWRGIVVMVRAGGLPHMGLPMGQKLVTFATNWVQTLRNAYL